LSTVWLWLWQVEAAEAGLRQVEARSVQALAAADSKLLHHVKQAAHSTTKLEGLAKGLKEEGGALGGRLRALERQLADLTDRQVSLNGH
jgi:hypothetical protein